MDTLLTGHLSRGSLTKAQFSSLVEAGRRLVAAGAREVYLLGGRALGCAEANGKWDLMVVLPDDAEPHRHAPQNLLSLVADLPLSFRVFAIGGARFAADRDDPASVSYGVARDGISIWDRSDVGLLEFFTLDDIGTEEMIDFLFARLPRRDGFVRDRQVSHKRSLRRGAKRLQLGDSQPRRAAGFETMSTSR